MKTLFKTILPVFLLGFLFTACSPKIPIGPSGPPRAQFTGNWKLTDVSFNSVNEADVPKAFGAVVPKVFLNSTWILNNDGSGYYTLANGTKQNIYWSVNGGDALGAMFTFTNVAEGQTPTATQTGYQMTISSSTTSALILKSLVYIGNKNGYVVYTFAKQ